MMDGRIYVYLGRNLGVHDINARHFVLQLLTNSGRECFTSHDLHKYERGGEVRLGYI